MLKLNQQTIRNWIDAGQLPCVRIGQRRVRIKRSDFDRLIEHGGAAESRQNPRRAPGPAYGRARLRRPRIRRRRA